MVMGQITGDRHIAFINNPAAGGLEAAKDMSIARGLSIVLTPRIEGARTERNS